jgi:G3E family GTPase
VEAPQLLQLLSSTSTAAQLGWVSHEHPAAGSYTALLLGAQLEAADVILLSAVEAVPPLALPLLQQVLSGFSSRAAVVLAGDHDTPPPQQLLGQRLHRHDAAAAGPVWVGVSQAAGAAAQQYHQQLLQPQPLYTTPAATAASGGACTSSSSSSSRVRTIAAAAGQESGGVKGAGCNNLCSWVFAARLPFHPGRLHTWLTQHFTVTQPGDTPAPQCDASNTQAAATAAAARCRQVYGQLLTSHGVVWLLGRERTAGEWVQVGPVLQLGPGEPWSPAAATTTPSAAAVAGGGAEGPSAAVAGGDGVSLVGGTQQAGGEEVGGNWSPGVGTRRQEVVFIGYGLQVRWGEGLV